MTAQAKSDLSYIFIGMITSTGVGGLIFQALGALVLGFLGALGSYLFVRFVKPRLETMKLLSKNNQNNNNNNNDDNESS